MTATTNDGLLQTTAVGGETSIDFDFPIYTTADLEVIRTRGGADTTLVLTTDYTIAASELNDPTGGVITLTSAAVAGDIYTCRSNIQEARSADFQQGGDFFSATVNSELDKIIRITQQLRRDLDRAVQISPTSTISPSSLPVTMDDPVAGSLLAFSSGGGIEPVSVASLGLSGLDTVLSSLAADDGLFWNGTHWVNSKVTPSKISTKQIPNGSITSVASATTIVLNSTTTNYFNITGTTTITGITLAEGVEVTVKFAGALTLTNGANLINISGANITTAAGDIAVFRGEASGVVRMIDYVRASGAPIAGVLSGALIYKTADQSIPNNTTTTITWAAEGYDIGNWWSSGSPNQFTVPTGITKVKVSVGTYIGLNSGGIVYVRKNGSSFILLSVANVANYSGHNTESPWFDAVSGDVIDFQMLQNDGASRTITYGNAYGSGTLSTWAAIEGK